MGVKLKTVRSCFPKLSISMPAIDILLIEDKEQDAYLIRRSLNQIGKIFWEETVEAGLKATHDEVFDLVLLPLSLQNKNSLDAFHQFFSQRRDIPIIILSDTDTKLLAEAALHQGAMAVLDKNMIDNSEYLIKMITAFMIKARFIKKSEELIAKADKEKGSLLRFWDRTHHPINPKA
jgi:DNA-binding NarL/FixJ family response regulator